MEYSLRENNDSDKIYRELYSTMCLNNDGTKKCRDQSDGLIQHRKCILKTTDSFEFLPENSLRCPDCSSQMMHPVD